MRRIRYGTNPIAWTNDDDLELGGDIPLETCLAQASQIGFDGIEMGRKFPREAAPLKEALAPHGISLVSGWHSLLLQGGDVETEMERIRRHASLLKALGCDVCIACECAQAIHGDDQRPLSTRPTLAEDEWDPFCAGLGELGEVCSGVGIKLAYHHHMGTVIQTEEEIDRLMAGTGMHVHLLLDTGHATLGGGDPAALAKRYTGRIVHLHFKNVRAEVRREAEREDLSFLEAVRRGIYTVPGDPEGCVDSEPVIAAAADAGYGGWLVIEAEQDPKVYDPVKYQTMGLEFLRAQAIAAGLDKEG